MLRFEKWREDFIPVGAVSAKPPQWVLPGLLPPGFTFLVGDPKTFKSTLILEVAAAVCEGRAIGDTGIQGLRRPGSLFYFASEQSASRLRFNYERILKRRLQPAEARKWNLVFARDPWRWEVGEELAEMLASVRPTVAVIDPLVHFHRGDENDARFIDPLIPVREAALKHGFSVVIVHHTNKSKGDGGGGGTDWSRMRGTSALWGMADAGIMARKMGSGTVLLNAEYKDHPPMSIQWRSSILDADAKAKPGTKGTTQTQVARRGAEQRRPRT